MSHQALSAHEPPKMPRFTSSSFVTPTWPVAHSSPSTFSPFPSFVTTSRRPSNLGDRIWPKSQPLPALSDGHHYQSPSHSIRSMSAVNSREEAATKDNGDNLTYAASGVDIDTEAASVSALIRSLKTLGEARKPGEVGAPVAHAGGFSGLIDFGEQLLALCTDGVGSKMQLAAELSRYDTVGIDCVAMNVNDLLCIGAEPLAFVDYIAAPAPNPPTWEQLGVGLARGCSEARVTLSGGESASLPDMVTHVDMSGTALGCLPKGSQLDGSDVQPGDVIIGLPASGVHSNGLSLVRRVLTHAGAVLTDAVPFDPYAPSRARDIEGKSLGDVVLTPTRIYVDPVIDLIKACRGESTVEDRNKPCEYQDIHGMVHVTGGGLSNFLRLNKDVGFVIDTPLPVLPEFNWIQQAGNVNNFEMWRTFNMGMGFAIIVKAAVASSVVQFLSARLAGCAQVGIVTSVAGKIEHVPANVTYDKY